MQISVAPMMDCTDRHDRYFLRIIAPHVLLYTEMITANALVHGDYQKLLAYDSFEHPIALQVGGNNPKDLAYCAGLAETFNYDEINLNVGCPSNRVKSGRFGACLMLEPALVGECVSAMQQNTKIPVTVKCRIGVDDQDSIESLITFIEIVKTAGCKKVIIHARKAWLNGLSPKENRTVPPLKYEVVHQIKKIFPQMNIVINGGIKSIQEIKNQLQFCDGVMIGREAYSNPYFLAEIEKEFYDTVSPLRSEVLEEFIPYIENQIQQGVRLSAITRHLYGLYHGQKNGRAWRRFLSENAYRCDADTSVLKKASQFIQI